MGGLLVSVGSENICERAPCLGHLGELGGRREGLGVELLASARHVVIDSLTVAFEEWATVSKASSCGICRIG